MDRQSIARGLVFAASVALVLALAAGYVRRAAVDSSQFSNRATAALEDPSVRSLIAARITDEVVLKSNGDLLAARPLIESAAEAIVGSRAFTGLFRSGVRDVHRALFDRDQDTLTLTLTDIGTVLAAAVEQLRPELARKLEASGRVELVKRDVGSLSATLARVADRVRLLTLLLWSLWALLVAAALASARDRRRTAVELGAGAAVGGVLLVVAFGVGRSLATHQVAGPEAQAAAQAVWDAFLSDLRAAAWILAGSGAVVAAAAASLIRPVELGEPLRRAAGWLAVEPRRPALRVLRGVGLVAGGVVVLTAREEVLQLLLTVIGVYLVYEGIAAVLRLVHKPDAPRDEQPAAMPRRRRGLVALVAIVPIAAAIAAFVGGGGTSTPPPAATNACNGHQALCDRPLDQVALPATHNAMSVPLPGWYSAEQDRPIADQLRDGVRGLLIDTHYADRLPNGKLRTDLGSAQQQERRAAQDGVSADAVEAAERLRDRLGFGGRGERGMYLCHTFCELGGTPLASVLENLHDFLVANPGEVVVVINQDYVTPADFVAAVNDAGLGGLAYSGPVDGTWPTLGELVERNKRVVFLAENHAGGAPWYRLAYALATEETPYTFHHVAQLTDASQLDASCRPNRGPDEAPLLLLNHWISTDPVPRPSDAEKVNAYDALLARAQACQRLRGHIPNLVAVNFYRRGDLLRVVDALNGISRSG